ncbi:MAG: prepilin-type N-terminal cleavage/methylation domain-containing protein [Dechloromonas sp.]|uniref:type IV pilus modification PilV family protein n=1 Tax=Dechloromonas sp. TaxID=1917218 RepID=UPI0027F3ED89|nr:prepilin-type N-terminal cleavage/methylation domain-containing protein [Dechloromonas sp.]MBT9523221.1 prepilin-type N-terminal cleavage/methylation domain-containing protein [Dechloromonas sp.]
MVHVNFNELKYQSGFLLLEVLIAIVIFSVGILAIVGLQATMVKNSTDARYRAVASQVAEQRIAQQWAAPTQSIAEADTDISGVLPSGTRTVIQVGNRFQVTVTWQQPGGDQHQFNTIAYVAGG